MKQEKVKVFLLFSRAFKIFRKNDPLRMAGATAFFTTFALPAVLLILIQVFGLVLNPRIMTRQLFHNLGEVVGRNTASELHKTLFNVRHLFQNGYEATLGFLFLIFVATTLMNVIKDSLNQLWNIRRNGQMGFRFEMKNRGKAFLVILFAGILFMVLLITDSAMALLLHRQKDHLPERVPFYVELLRQFISFVLVTIWFSLLFKFLPDGRPSWKTIFAGAAFTGLLFTLGKLLLQWLLSYSSMQTIYGASTSSVLLLLFVFYSSFIFYYGACFTRVWSEMYNKPIQPAPWAGRFEGVRVSI